MATLTVLVDPTAGDALGRLLTGARWRIGPRDLAALEARARALVHARRPSPPDGEGAGPAVEAPVERLVPGVRDAVQSCPARALVLAE